MLDYSYSAISPKCCIFSMLVVKVKYEIQYFERAGESKKEEEMKFDFRFSFLRIKKLIQLWNEAEL